MRAVIFDVDGTLWDSTEHVAASWRQALNARGIPSAHVTAERLKSEFGKLLPEIGRSLFPDMEKEEALLLTEYLCDAEIEMLRTYHPAPYDGVPELLSELRARGHQVSIVSNCQKGYIEMMLSVTGLGPLVDAHLCAGDTGLGKAETIRIAAERFGLISPVYVGDTSGDETAARAAGIPFIHASYGFGKAAHPDAVIHAPLELPEVLKNL